jgi:hypothetical protein
MMGGVIYVIQNNGLFSLSDSRSSSGSTTFYECGISSVQGLGGVLYIRNYGGTCLIGGSDLSFSNCFATNGTEIFIDSNNLEESIKNGNVVIDFDYDTTNDESIIGTSNNNLFSLTPIHAYDCFIKNGKAEKEGNSCLLSCSLECPISTIEGIIITLYGYFFIIFLVNGACERCIFTEAHECDERCSNCFESCSNPKYVIYFYAFYFMFFNFSFFGIY